ARRPGAHRDEADVPEGEHTGVADEDVQPDDDLHVDKGRLEVALVRQRGKAAEQRHQADEHRRRDELRGFLGNAHTRSTAWARNGVNSPSGRRSSTSITSPNTAEST